MKSLMSSNYIADDWPRLTRTDRLRLLSTTASKLMSLCCCCCCWWWWWGVRSGQNPISSSQSAVPGPMPPTVDRSWYKRHFVTTDRSRNSVGISRFIKSTVIAGNRVTDCNRLTTSWTTSSLVVQLVRQPSCRYELYSQPRLATSWQVVANQLAKWNLALTPAECRKQSVLLYPHQKRWIRTGCNGVTWPTLQTTSCISCLQASVWIHLWWWWWCKWYWVLWMMLIIIRLPDTYSSASQRWVLVAACLPSVHSLSTFSVQLIVISEHFDNNISTIIQPKSQSVSRGPDIAV